MECLAVSRILKHASLNFPLYGISGRVTDAVMGVMNANQADYLYLFFSATMYKYTDPDRRADEDIID